MLDVLKFYIVYVVSFLSPCYFYMRVLMMHTRTLLYALTPLLSGCCIYLFRGCRWWYCGRRVPSLGTSSFPSIIGVPLHVWRILLLLQTLMIYLGIVVALSLSLLLIRIIIDAPQTHVGYSMFFSFHIKVSYGMYE